MAELLAACSRALVLCISSLIKVPQIQRQGLYIADILTETLTSSKHVCVKLTFLFSQLYV